MELFGFIGVRGGQVFRFAEIVSQVVEFEVAIFEEFEEFPVAVADGADGGGAPLVASGAQVAGEVPEEGLAIRGSRRGFSSRPGSWCRRGAGCRGRGLSACEVEEGRVEVDAIDGAVGRGAGVIVPFQEKR